MSDPIPTASAKSPTSVGDAPIIPAAALSTLREYLIDASLPEEMAQKRVLVKLLQRLPFAMIWLASLIDDPRRKLEFVRLVRDRDFGGIDPELLKIDSREAHELAGVTSGEEALMGGVTEVEFSAFVAFSPQRRSVLNLADRWLLKTARSAGENGDSPAAHILPMLEFAERVLRVNAKAGLLSVAKAVEGMEKADDQPLEESDWRRHVFRHLSANRHVTCYDVHSVLEAIPRRLRATSWGGEVTSGVTATDVNRLLKALGIRCVWKKRKGGRKKSS